MPAIILLVIGLVLILFPRAIKEYNQDAYRNHPMSFFVGGYRDESYVWLFRIFGVLFIAASGVITYLLYGR